MNEAARVQTTSALNELLRGELSAVETYNQALAAVKDDLQARAQLAECRASHESRALRLRSEIVDCGGDPVEGSGVWGAFAKLVEGGATVVGERLAVHALEVGEDHGLKQYQEVLPKLDVSTRSTVSTDLYPQQVRTHAIMSALKNNLSDAASAPAAGRGGHG